MNPRAFEVEFFETASQIPKELWDALFQPPAAGRWWYETLDQSGIEDQFTFFYGLIIHLGCPVGIAPVFVMDVPVEQVAPEEFLRLFRLVGKIVPSVLSQRTLFVGSPILDESRVGLIPNVNRRAALLSLQIALEKKADQLRAPMIVWKDFLALTSRSRFQCGAENCSQWNQSLARAEFPFFATLGHYWPIVTTNRQRLSPLRHYCL